MILLDAGLLLAFVDTSDEHHKEAVELLHSQRPPLYVPALVIPEVSYLLATRIGVNAELRFLRDLADGHFLMENVEPVDWRRIVSLVDQYHDLPLGSVDASIIAAAERLNIRTIATFDRRHFTVVRPGHVDAFELLP